MSVEVCVCMYVRSRVSVSDYVIRLHTPPKERRDGKRITEMRGKNGILVYGVCVTKEMSEAYNFNHLDSFYKLKLITAYIRNNPLYIVKYPHASLHSDYVSVIGKKVLPISFLFLISL